MYKKIPCCTAIGFAFYKNIMEVGTEKHARGLELQLEALRRTRGLRLPRSQAAPAALEPGVQQGRREVPRVPAEPAEPRAALV